MVGTGNSEVPSGGVEDENWEWKIVTLHDTARLSSEEETARLNMSI